MALLVIGCLACLVGLYCYVKSQDPNLSLWKVAALQLPMFVSWLITFPVCTSWLRVWSAPERVTGAQLVYLGAPLGLAAAVLLRARCPSVKARYAGKVMGVTARVLVMAGGALMIMELTLKWMPS